MTGGLPGVLRGAWPPSIAGGSSTQTSTRSSAISTNSRFSIFFTVFGERAAAGLYGPGEVSVGGTTNGARGGGSDDAAAVARRSRPADGPVETNVGIAGNAAGSGISPSLGVSAPGWGH